MTEKGTGERAPDEPAPAPRPSGAEPPPGKDVPPADDLGRELHFLNRRHTYDAQAPLTSHRRLAGRFVIAIKRRLRPWLYGTLSPAFERQQEFNRSLVRYANALQARLSEIERTAAETRECQRTLLEKVDALDVKLESYMSVLSRRIALLERTGAEKPAEGAPRDKVGMVK